MGNATIISTGTLNPEHLIPAFLSALQDAMDSRAMQPGQDDPYHVARYGQAEDRMGAIERSMETDGYYDSEDCTWDMEWLQERLEYYAPEGTYFGASDGDGACFGFWDHVESDDDSTSEVA